MSVLVVYWTGTGNTLKMAEAITEGIKQSGKDVTLEYVSKISPEEASKYDKIVFGCSAMGQEELDEDEFEPFFADIINLIPNKKVALFGSYGWGDGEWMNQWEERCLQNSLVLFEGGLKINSTPSEEELEECKEFGKKFTEF